MKGQKPFALIALAILICAILSGCAAHAPTNGPSALNITPFTLIPGVVNVSYEQVLLASGGTQPYTWTLTGGALPPGLSLQSNGTVSGTPTLQSGITYPNTYNFTAKVVDSQTPVAAYNTVSTSITINPALSLAAATLSPGIVGSSYSSVVTASNGYAGPNCYTYALASGNLPDGLTLTPAGCGTSGAPLGGTISGTPTVAGTFVFTIQATDAYQETATGQFTIVISGRLQGSYVMTINGFQGGVPFYQTASFVADGNGNITSGVLDRTGGGSVVPNAPLTGTYNLPVGTNLGSLVINSAVGDYTYEIILSTAGDSRIIAIDPNIYGSGLVRKQTATALPSSATGYAFGLYGNDAAGAHYAAAGALAANSSMTITGGEEDINDNGTVSPQVLITGGNLAATPPDPNTGRGQATLTTASGTLQYAYYVVSSTELAGVAIDNSAPQTSISILEQGAGGTTGGGSFSNATLKGQSVIQLSGLDPTLSLPDVSVGVVTFDGAGNIARTDGLPAYLTDENDGGTVSQNNITSGTYNVDPTCGTIQYCGRVTVTGIGANQPVWYLVGSQSRLRCRNRSQRHLRQLRAAKRLSLLHRLRPGFVPGRNQHSDGGHGHQPGGSRDHTASRWHMEHARRFQRSERVPDRPELYRQLRLQQSEQSTAAVFHLGRSAGKV